MKFNSDHDKFSLVVAQWLKSYRFTEQSRLGRIPYLNTELSRRSSSKDYHEILLILRRSQWHSLPKRGGFGSFIIDRFTVFPRPPTTQWSWFPHQMSIKDIWLPFGQLYSVILAKGRFTTFDPSDFARSS